MNDELQRIAIPDEARAAQRSWQVIESAFAERAPKTQRSRQFRPAIVVLVALAAIAAFASTPGRAIVNELREAVGVDRAQPALFSLPASGRMLVSSDAGMWVVRPDGQKRLLGAYREAGWSPFGRFVVATSENELAALEPTGEVRWTLARRHPRNARWTGTTTDTQIAYTDRSGVHVVAGDGTGDRLLLPYVQARVAWRPGSGFVLAYATSRQVGVVDTARSEVLWRTSRRVGPVSAIEWSSDGQRLLVLSRHRLSVFNARGGLETEETPSEDWPDVAATFRPGSREIAVGRVHGSQSSAYYLEGRTLFNGTGVFRDLAWSPDGQWLLVTWPTADQWVFVRGRGKAIRAISNVAEQFRSRSAPRIEGWCCAP